MSSPCFKCESRGSCRHRTVEEPQMIAEPKHEPEVTGSTFTLGGLYRKRKASHHSMFGKAGNPTKREFDELMKKRGL